MTELEHHSNFLPWKELARRKNAEFPVLAPFTKEGLIDIETLSSMIDSHTRIVAFSAISNVMGGINPTPEIIRIVKEKNPECITVVDAAQAAGHIDIDTTKWNADFIAFSGHKNVPRLNGHWCALRERKHSRASSSDNLRWWHGDGCLR